MAVSTLIPQDPSVSGVKVSVKWNKSALLISSPLGKARHLLQLWATTNLRMIPKNEDDRILNAFTTTVNPTEGIIEDEDEEEDLE